MKTVDDFVAAVEEMREAQREYFHSHTQSTLNRAISCERRVDEWLKEHNKKIAQQRERQIPLDEQQPPTPQP